MRPYATKIDTPAGRIAAPLNPMFAQKMKHCHTDVDLFRLVDRGNSIDPDAINEIMARGLYEGYQNWLNLS